MTWLVILNQSPFSWDDHLVVRSAQQLSFSTGPTEETLNRINIWKKRPGISNIINISPIATPKWKHWPHHHSFRHRYIHRHRRHHHDLLHHQPYVAIRWIEFGASPYAKFVAVFQVAFAQICCGDVFIFLFFFGGLGFLLEFVSCHSSAGLSVRQSARIPSFQFWSFEAG